MVEKDKYLVVVSIRQGKNFPRRPKHVLVVEARFEGELLSSDPVEHSETPDFTQELAWELDKKSLHQHRMQRTSVKVQVYCQDVVSSVREAIGYVILDLRSAQSHLVIKSYPLLHTKYKRSRPEIELCLYIDEGKSDVQSNGQARTTTTAAASAAGGSSAHFTESVNPKLLKPVYNESYQFYQIGPVESNGDKFRLSISIHSAANLVQLIPTNVSLPASGYFFYYSLLGNDVVTESFHDLLNPRFPIQRVSTCLSGHLELIRQFFATQPGLEVHLCCGEQMILGSCLIPLSGLVKKGSSEIYMKPLSFNGTIQLTPPKSSKLVLSSALLEDQKPIIGVSVVLQIETDARHEHDSYKEAAKGRSVGDGPQVSDDPITRGPKKNPAAVSGGGGEQHPTRAGYDLDGSYTETLERQNSRSDEKSNDVKDDVRQTGDEANGGASRVGIRSQRGGESSDLDSRTTGGEDISSDTRHHLSVPPVPHHFKFSIDLKSVADLSITHPVVVFLRYTYLFFGSSSPVQTEPPVEVRRGTEVHLPKSCCEFNFATTFEQLQDTFNRVPLVVEVWQRDRQMSQNSCFGVAEISLANVLKSSKSKAKHVSGSAGWRQSCTDRFAIKSVESEQRRLGDLQVALTLEDWGSIVPQTVVLNDQSRSDEMLHGVGNTPPGRVSAAKALADPRETVEYQVAMELELWKEQQQKMFEEQLRARERQHLKELEEEYKRRDKERQLLVAKQKSELDKLYEELRKKLTELEKCEKDVAAEKQKVLNNKTTLEREHKRKMAELEDASRRFKDDCDHQVSLERKKVQDLEENLFKLKQRLAEEESKYQKLGREFEAYKSKASSQPEVKLQAEIMQLRVEKTNFEKQLDKVQQSKVQYKQQFVKAFRELGKRDKKHLKESRAKERQRLREIEHLKLHYQMKVDAEAEARELNQIKKEKQELERSSGIASQSFGSRVTGGGDLENSEEDEHLIRLITERDLLLKTGTYTASDSIIANLEREIRELSQQKSGKTKYLTERSLGPVVY